MLSTKSTEGPWILDERWEHALLIIPQADATRSSGAHFVDEVIHRREHLRELASIKREPYKFDGISKAEHYANAFVLAASWELLEALEEARAWIPDGSGRSASKKGARQDTLNAALDVI